MNIKMTCHIKKVLNICDRHFFARPVLSENFVKHFRFGPSGDLLRNNVYQEWVSSNIVKEEYSVFPYSGGDNVNNISKGMKESFEYVKSLCNGQLPFGVALTNKVEANNVCTHSDSASQNEVDYFKPQTHTNLNLLRFVQPANASNLFDQWQRQRKVWWRKFSASPGRFSLADVRNEDGCLVVQIRAEFPWGSQTVETIAYKKSSPFNSLDKIEKDIFQAKAGRQRVIPHVLESSINLDVAVFAFLCDAYDEIVFLGLPREVMRFHHRLAPYKASFAVSSSSAAVGEELSLLATYLNKQLRGIGVSTLLLPDIRNSLESQFVRNDGLGIPYTVVLNDSSLKNGIIGLRSRDTTLKEQVHITNLKEYMDHLLRNY